MRRSLRYLLGVGALIAGSAALTGCTADAGAQASTPPSSATEVAPTSPTPLATPTSDPAQLAIVTFDNTRTPTVSAGTTGPSVMDGTFRIDGACRGDSFAFRLRDATVGAPERDIVSGEIDCDDPGSLPTLRFDLGPQGGPVQMVVTDADDATQGWVRAIRVD